MTTEPSLPVSPDAMRVLRVVLAQPAAYGCSPSPDQNRLAADLEADNSYDLVGSPGPYVLHLGLLAGRLVFDTRDAAGAPIAVFGLALGPFRRLIKDYQFLVESHEMALAEGRGSRIQAIDMGRRGLHDEGGRLMIARLAGRIAIDMKTARQLFSLLCALLQRVEGGTVS